MHRKEKQISDQQKLHEIIRECEVVRLGLSMENRPYIIPLSFGFDGKFIYFHTAKKGLKIDYFMANPNVCFEFENKVAIIPHETKPCNWSCSFQSIIGFGIIQELESIAEKSRGLECIMHQYSESKWQMPQAGVEAARVWKIIITSMTGKQSADFFKPAS